MMMFRSNLITSTCSVIWIKSTIIAWNYCTVVLKCVMEKFYHKTQLLEIACCLEKEMDNNNTVKIQHLYRHENLDLSI